MCGIVGIAGHLTTERLATALRAMNAALSHRGPDDEGVWIGEHFAFAMRRLSVIDLVNGHQPMWDSRTGTGIVYNGEVYNYRALRKELERSEVHFHTTSDTEVVLQSLAAKGSAAVNDWNGMFAVAQWNDCSKELLLIRDRIGVKPLYYFWDGTILMFASEIKALLASGLVPRRLNRQAIWDYLTFRYVPGPETMWQNVWKLPPGHMLEWSPRTEPRVSRYWKSNVISSKDRPDLDFSTKQFEELFLRAVEQTLVAADVPVGVMLSGGIDSSSLAAAAVELNHKQFHTFSVAFSQGGDYSELNYARQVANHLGVQHHEVVLDRSDFIDLLPAAVHAADEPLGDPATVPLLAVSRLAREHVKVVLSGEGADEVLGGYNFQEFRKKIHAIELVQSLPLFLQQGVGAMLGLVSGHYAERFARVATTPLHQWNIVHKNHMTRLWTEGAKASLWPSFAGRDSDDILAQMYLAAESPNPLDQILSVYQQSWLVEDLLMKADKMSMAASVEVRVPFLDHELVEWANRQPIAVKIGRAGARYVTKHVLRRFARKRLPPQIVNRPKLGFPVPICEWLADPTGSEWATMLLTGTKARARHCFKSEPMRRQISAAASGDADAAYRTWLLIVLEVWLREFDVEIDGDPDCAPRGANAVLGSSVPFPA
jgi:asparagine synthase (glutamine-hydrolysing)